MCLLVGVKLNLLHFPNKGLYFVLPSDLNACKNDALGLPSGIQLQCIHPLLGSPGV